MGKNMTALYALTQQYMDAANKLADMDLDEQTLADTLEGLSGDFEAKAVSVAMIACNFESTAEQIKAAEKAMSERRRAIEARADRLRTYLKDCMTATGIKRVECPHFVLSIKATPAAVVVFDEDQIPAAFMRQPDPPKPSPDKKAIAESIKAGFDVAGCRLESGTRLDIR